MLKYTLNPFVNLTHKKFVIYFIGHVRNPGCLYVSKESLSTIIGIRSYNLNFLGKYIQDVSFKFTVLRFSLPTKIQRPLLRRVQTECFYFSICIHRSFVQLN